LAKKISLDAVDAVDVCVSASIGVAFFPDDAASAAELIRNADNALYRSKGDGKGRVSFFKPRAKVVELV
jgi:diguanylate cyclase (GGDEF)-like protein